MFSNANLVCRKVIHEEEFLPDDTQELTVGIHPFFWNVKPRFFTYERDRKSRAYIPYNAGEKYVMGSLFCGHTDKFLYMSEVLQSRIDEDLANRKIALWHDESHLNKYVIEKSSSLKFISPSYIYPEGVNFPFEMKMELLDKRKHFDVSSFKRDATLALVTTKPTLMFRAKRKLKRILRYLFIDVLYLRDSLLCRHV
ncbi:MAG: hypothetical protein IJR85_06715 [Synergistaceae bacterium]|nr:hypothetical protein [Synergistaceae bacterium]